MRKVGVAALGLFICLVDGAEKAFKMAEKEGEEFLIAYKAAQRERQEVKK